MGYDPSDMELVNTEMRLQISYNFKDTTALLHYKTNPLIRYPRFLCGVLQSLQKT